ncbi:MAG: EFR1 family ferrodoxin [Prevotella sp.]|nr:EFR1 family ferrodoxin [Prevotella sp.]
MIFYFSGTGNTKWAAQKISKAVGEKLINIAEEIEKDCIYQLSSDERVGFCFPVHGWRPPFIVRKFIAKMHIEKIKDNFCWALCTAGDDIGLTMEYLDRDLKKVGLKVQSVFSLIMPESYVGLPFMNVDNEEKERYKKQTSASQLEQIIQFVKNSRMGITMTYKGHWPRINSYLLGEFFVRRLVTDKHFYVKKKICVTCGKCVKSCPVGNMNGGIGKLPEWKHTGRCVTCFSCYHHCPIHAIEYGSRTKNKGQYYFTENR